METGCRDGNLQLVKDIIFVSPGTVNIPNEDGDTPLMLSSLGGHYDVVKLLLSRKVDVNVKNNRAETALILACRKPLLYKTLDRGEKSYITVLGCILAHDLHVQQDTSRDSEIYTNIVELLLSHGADENVTDNDGVTPLILACIFGDLKVEETLISRGVNINYTGVHNTTALMWACVFGHGNIVDKLLQAGADVNIKINKNISALSISSYFDRDNIVDRLISHEASVDEADSEECTPLHYAAMFGFPHVASQLISGGADMEKLNSYDLSPLIVASWCGQSGVAGLLISNGADTSYEDTDDTTHLMWSTMFGHTDTVRLLVSRGANINTRDKDGYTALMRACEGGWDDIVELLVSHGASVNVINNTDETPLTLVCKNIQNVYDNLLDNDDDDDDDEVELFFNFITSKVNPLTLECYMNQLKPVCTDRMKSYMLGFAHLTGDTDLLSSLQRVFSDQHTDTPAVTPDGWDTRHDKVLKLLLSKGANVSKYGNSALIIACIAGYKSGARILLEHNADVNVSNSDDDTALSVASREGHVDVVEVLLDHKAGVNVTGSDGDTPLIEASREGHHTVVQVLLKHGAEINISNNDGETALTVAEEGGHDTVVDLLLKHQADTNTGETESSVSPDQRTGPTQPEDKDTTEKEDTESGGKNIGQEKKPFVNVRSNKEESEKGKKFKKGRTKERKKSGLGLIKSKRVVKAGEILRENLCSIA